MLKIGDLLRNHVGGGVPLTWTDRPTPQDENINRALRRQATKNRQMELSPEVHEKSILNIKERPKELCRLTLEKYCLIFLPGTFCAKTGKLLDNS